MTYREYLAALVASVLVSSLLAIFFWRRRSSPGAMALVGLSGVILIWALGYIIETVSTTLSGHILANDIEYIGFVNIPVLWFIFTIQYSRYNNWLTRHWPFLFIIPFITLILVWTNQLHGWMWYDAHLQQFGEFTVQIKTYGPWFWVHTGYSYSLIIAGTVVIGMSLTYPRRLYRDQIIILLIAIILPMIWNTIYIFRAAPTYHIDMTPPAFVVSGIVVALGLFRFRLLKIVPIALNTVVENMDDVVIVLDPQDKIVDLNRAARKITGHSASELIGKPANVSLAKFPELLKHIREPGNLQAEIVINREDNDSYYELSLIPLYDRRDILIGRIITLHNQSTRKRMEQSLKEYAQKITQVQEEERKRIAYELHDDTAQYLSLLKLEIDSLLNSGKIQSPEVLEKLRYLEKDADRAFNDVRRYSHELRPGVLEHLGLSAALEQMAEDTNSLKQLDVKVNVEGDDTLLAEDVKLGFFRIAQEAVNNARKHAKAKGVNINLQFSNQCVMMSVMDDGIGFYMQEATARARKKGSMGLMSMQERAKLVGADLKIVSEPGQGTTVLVEMPL